MSAYTQELLQAGDKCRQRGRIDKRVKCYLAEKRPIVNDGPITDDHRLYNYRTSARVGFHEALEDKADPELLEFLRAEYLWAVSHLMRLDPVSMAGLGYDVPGYSLQIDLFRDGVTVGEPQS